MTVLSVLLALFALSALAVMAMRIRARAIRRCGELLKDIPAKAGSTAGEPGPQRSERARAAQAAGLSPDQTKDALRVARVPADDFEAVVESDDPPTVTQLAAAVVPPPESSSVAEVESVPTAAVPPRAATLGEAHVLARLFVKPATTYQLAEKLGCSPRWVRACLWRLEQGGYAVRLGEVWVSKLALDELRRALGQR